MRPLEHHERFEMETLDFLNSQRLLHQVVFRGGTMLRLCFEMKRFSVDMDFYFKQKPEDDSYFRRLNEELGSTYTITDSHDKFNTMLVELAHASYPRRLKIEINKNRFYRSFRRAIAFSPHSTLQVPVSVIPLDKMLENKIEALLTRREIRDAFDVDFLMKRGLRFPGDAETRGKVLQVIKSFSKRDFDVKLGSLLAPDIRAYYRENRFSDLESRLGGNEG